MAKCNAALVDARSRRDLKQGEVAQHIGISRTYYNQIENGIKTPSLLVSQKIAHFFGTTVEELFPPDFQGGGSRCPAQTA